MVVTKKNLRGPTGFESNPRVLQNLIKFIFIKSVLFIAIPLSLNDISFDSVFFQVPAPSNEHFLVPMMEALNLKREDQFPYYDLNKVPPGTCFQQTIFAGNYIFKIYTVLQPEDLQLKV